jgi:hypothetical protein
MNTTKRALEHEEPEIITAQSKVMPCRLVRKPTANCPYKNRDRMDEHLRGPTVLISRIDIPQ